MKLLKMTANFGKLKNDTLELHDGLNVISLPNESGKSTWTEFLLAMLYGVDTSERAKAGAPIPVKEHYKPWDGGAMQGSIELAHDGKHITIERTSTARVPMGQFSAYETDSGVPVTDYDGKSCGTALIGAERSVYERSGFLRQRGVGLSKDASLEQRLSGLVTAGDEDYSYTAVEAALRKVRNSCKSNAKNGLLPAAEQELAQVRATLNAISEQQETLLSLQQQERDLIDRRGRLQVQIRAAEAAEARQRKAQLAAQEAAVLDAEARRKALEETCATLPPKQTLAALSDAAANLSERMQSARFDAAMARPEPPQTPDFPMFAGLTPEEATRKAAEDSARAQELLTPVVPEKLPVILPCIFAAGAAACAVLAFVLPLLWLLIPAGLLLFGIPLWLILNSQKKTQAEAKTAKNAAEAGSLLSPYGVSAPQALPALAERFSVQTADYEEKLAQLRRQKDEAAERIASLEREQTELLKKLQQFFPGCDSLSAADRLLDEAMHTLDELDKVIREEQSAKNTLDVLRAMIPDAEAPETPEFEGTPIDLPVARAQLTRINEQLVSLRASLNHAKGQLDSMGDRMVLAAREEQLSARVAELSEKYAALTLALETLDTANKEMQSRFSPMLCSKAAELFARLTGGKYDRLLLDQELNATCRINGDSVTHKAQELSCGTTDQAYLAVRLAICELLLPDAPLILDDALVAFDDERCRLAMDVLREVAQTRQVILFSCQSREARM